MALGLSSFPRLTRFIQGLVHHGRCESFAILVDHLALVRLDGVEHALDQRLRILDPGGQVASDETNGQKRRFDSRRPQQSQGHRVHLHRARGGVRPVEEGLTELNKDQLPQIGGGHAADGVLDVHHGAGIVQAVVLGRHEDHHVFIPLRGIVGTKAHGCWHRMVFVARA
eukprot:Skav226379  [mRNA]  locus=scaffold722:129045:142904:- [translate_table: standard]